MNSSADPSLLLFPVFRDARRRTLNLRVPQRRPVAPASTGLVGRPIKRCARTILTQIHAWIAGRVVTARNYTVENQVPFLDAPLRPIPNRSPPSGSVAQPFGALSRGPILDELVELAVGSP